MWGYARAPNLEPQNCIQKNAESKHPPKTVTIPIPETSENRTFKCPVFKWLKHLKTRQMVAILYKPFKNQTICQWDSF